MKTIMQGTHRTLPQTFQLRSGQFLRPTPFLGRCRGLTSVVLPESFYLWFIHRWRTDNWLPSFSLNGSNGRRVCSILILNWSIDGRCGSGFVDRRSGIIITIKTTSANHSSRNMIMEWNNIPCSSCRRCCGWH